MLEKNLVWKSGINTILPDARATSDLHSTCFYVDLDALYVAVLNAPATRFLKVPLQKCALVSVPRTVDAMSESNSPKTDTSSSSLLRQFRFQKKQTKAINMCKISWRTFLVFLSYYSLIECNRCVCLLDSSLRFCKRCTRVKRQFYFDLVVYYLKINFDSRNLYKVIFHLCIYLSIINYKLIM